MTTRRSSEQIIDAIAAGARSLFLERSPSAISMREIAAAADVNLGLIHRYVGSKDDVIALVLERHTAAARAAVDASPDRSALLHAIAGAVVTRPSTGRLVAGLVLDGIDITRFKREFPLLEQLGTDGDNIDATFAYALALGWEVFGPTLLNAIGEAPTNETLTERLELALHAISAMRAETVR